jgi:hypothetical protein
LIVATLDYPKASRRETANASITSAPSRGTRKGDVSAGAGSLDVVIKCEAQLLDGAVCG